MKKASHVLLVLLLILAPWQSYAHGSCDEDDSSDITTTQARGGNSAALDDVQATEAPCSGYDCSCCSFLCMQHCNASAHAIGAAFDGLIESDPPALWRSAAPRHYFSVILPTDTRPPQIPA